MTWRSPAVCAIVIMASAWMTLAVNARPQSTAKVSAVRTVPVEETVSLAPQFNELLEKGVREVELGLGSQPDVASVSARIVSDSDHDPLRVVVVVVWATPTPPPEMRLGTIADWVRTVFKPVADVKVEVRDDAGENDENLMDDRDNKTEPATPRRRQEAREKGHVARSADLNAALALLAVVVTLHLTSGTILGGFSSGLRASLEQLSNATEPSSLGVYFGGATTFVVSLVPLLVVIAIVTIASHLMQGGLTMSADPLAPKLERIDPSAGVDRIFSLPTMVRMSAAILKIAIVMIVFAITLWQERGTLLSLSDLDLAGMGSAFGGVIFTLSIRIALVLLGLAILDWGWQRFQYERDLRMSREEVREELRRYEGDPGIRDRRRALVRRIATQGMLKSIESATIVIAQRNGIAVALRYDAASMDAPVMVGKGTGAMADRIRDIAEWHHIPVVVKANIARELYRQGEVGEVIPRGCFEAVAEIVAQSIRLAAVGA